MLNGKGKKLLAAGTIKYNSYWNNKEREGVLKDDKLNRQGVKILAIE